MQRGSFEEMGDVGSEMFDCGTAQAWWAKSGHKGEGGRFHVNTRSGDAY